MILTIIISYLRILSINDYFFKFLISKQQNAKEENEKTGGERFILSPPVFSLLR